MIVDMKKCIPFILISMPLLIGCSVVEQPIYNGVNAEVVLPDLEVVFINNEVDLSYNYDPIQYYTIGYSFTHFGSDYNKLVHINYYLERDNTRLEGSIYFNRSLSNYSRYHLGFYGNDEGQLEVTFYTNGGDFMSFSSLANIYSEGAFPIDCMFWFPTLYSDANYDNGLVDSYNNGYDRGYTEGYNEGVSTASDFSFSTLLNTIFQAPVQMFNNAFNFTFFGINIAGLIRFILSIGLVLLVIRILKRR